jgi:hypothetical protein
MDQYETPFLCEPAYPWRWTVNIMGRHSDIGCNHETACRQIVADEIEYLRNCQLRPFSGLVGQ